MPLLKVRDCPEDIYQKIVFVAKKQHRTLSQQVVLLLETGRGQEQSNCERHHKITLVIRRRIIYV